MRHTIATIHARTDIVLSVRGTLRRRGLTNNNTCCFRYPITWSLSRYQPNCGTSHVFIKKPSTTCSSAAPQDALQELALDPRFVGGQLGMIGVLHTWTRDLLFHPHVHMLAPAGGISPDGESWRPCRNDDFLVHVVPLSELFRGKFRAGLMKLGLDSQVPTDVWHKPWVVNSRPVGNGRQALAYLSHYLLRVAISNKRILSMDNDQVTFQYKESKTGERKTCTLPAEAFIGRFLQHVLPKGFVKIRYFGYLGTAKRPLLKRLRILLLISNPVPQVDEPTHNAIATKPAIPCPNCGQHMRLMNVSRPQSRCPP